MTFKQGKNGISAKIICDSISPSGVRLTTFEDTFHRWILAENNTHRAISKNLQSSRAVPLKKAIELVKEQPAYPVHFGKNQAGMVARTEMEFEDKVEANRIWDECKDFVIESVLKLDALQAHKQWASRILEPFSLTKAVQTGTDWDNLMWLRNDEEAQPEYKELAECKQECFDESAPQKLYYGEWHLPYINTDRDNSGILVYLDSNGDVLTLDEAKKISASCCAQISYRRLNDSKEKALEIYEKLFSGRKPHMSPTEHQGTPIKPLSGLTPFPEWEYGVTHVDRNGILHSGNFTGWIQYRQTLPNNVFKL